MGIIDPPYDLTTKRVEMFFIIGKFVILPILRKDYDPYLDF